MHQAYNVQSIVNLKHGVQIESIEAYGNNVILGTRSGELIMYSVEESGAVDILMFNRNFKKAITQMKVIAVEHLLFVLTDATIHVCDISHVERYFSVIHTSAATSGCSLFTMNVKSRQPNAAETTTVIRTCCAIKRRLEFFFWKVDTFSSSQFSIELKDVPKALCWIDDVVCIGFKDEYVIYNIFSTKPEKHDLIITSSSHSVNPCISLIKNNLLGVSKDEYLVAIDPSLYAKDDKPATRGSIEAAPASAVPKHTPKPMPWSSPLLDLVWDEPYAIGRVSNAVEVRSLDANGLSKNTLVQSIPELGKTKFLVRSERGTIFAATVSELWCIRMADIPAQRQQMLQQKKYQLAIDLTSISSEPKEVREETIRQIHMRFAKELFDNKQFAAAMKEFERGGADPYDVIRLFPNLLQDQSGKPTSSTAADGDDGVAVPVPVLPVPQLDDKDMEHALLALIEFLAQARQKEVCKIRDAKSTSKSLLSIIDTTLLKCYLQTNDSLVAPILRLGHCHLEESEKTLKKHEKIAELIILYQMKNKHKKALELLQKHAEIAGTDMYGYERTIRYLHELGTAHLPLIFEFSNWVLSKNPEDGLRIFTDNIIEVETLPRANVLDFLISRHKHLVIPYLEHVIEVWHDNNTLLHNVLVMQYRERIQNLMEQLKSTDVGTNIDDHSSEKREQVEKYRAKLCNLLKNSPNYSPHVVLQDFPTNMLLEERALILGRLKKHEKVFAIYIQLLGDVQKATEYCEQHYAESNDIFLTLLKTILNPLKQPPYEDVPLHPDFITPNHDIILDLLNKYATKINPTKVWPYLPNDMPLHRLRNYMEIVLRTLMSEQNHMLIMNGLMNSQILRTKELIQQHENMSVEITEFSVCPECKKRFTNQTAFVRYPSGEVVHLSCHDKRTQQSAIN